MTALDVDVLVVGGGPAGLSAATELRRRGVRHVLVVEQDVEAGGVPRHCGHSPFGMREFGRVLTGARYAQRLVAAATKSGVDLRLRHRVIALREAVAEIVHPEGSVAVRARRVVLASGIREQTASQRLLPGTRPAGIMTTGVLQDWVFLRRLLPFGRPLIVGSELVTMSAILTCRGAGMQPVALVESERRPRVGRAIASFATLVGLPAFYGASIIDIKGTHRVEAVALGLANGRVLELDCDGVVLTGRFSPEATLARLARIALDPATGGPVVDSRLRTGDSRIFAAGNVLRGVKTAGQCWSEGRRVARVVAASLQDEG